MITLLYKYLPPFPNKAELEGILNALGFQLGLSELREPGWISSEIPKLKQWHTDGTVIEQLIMWASISPPLYRLKDTQRVVLVNPGDVVLVDNFKVEHRMPIDTANRWFYRGIVNTRGH